MKKYYFIASFYLLVLGVFFTACQSKDDSKYITVSMNTWPGYEPILLAKEKGYIRDNVKINRMDSATDVITAFHSGITDVAFVTLDEVLTLRDRIDYGIKIIAILDTSHGGDAILSQSHIKKLKDLKGKKVGVESTAIGAYLLLRAFSLNDEISLSDIEIVPMLYSKHEEAFINSAVDAVATFEPIKSALLKRKANVLFDSSQIPNEILDVMIVKDETIEAKGDEIKEMLSGWFESIEFLEKYHDKAMSMMAKYEGISSAEFNIAHGGLKVPNLSDNKKMLSLNNGEFLKHAIDLEKFLLLNEMISKEDDLRKIITDGLLPR